MIKRAIRIGALLGGLIGLAAGITIAILLASESGRPGSTELVALVVETLFIAVICAGVGALIGFVVARWKASSKE